MYDDETTFLAIPGPVEIHPRVYRAMDRHVYGHRTDHFRQIYDDCAKKFGETINTTRDTQFHAGSGSLGLHAAITNFITDENTVINCNNGKFGERVAKISKRFAGTQISVNQPWGQAIRPEQVKEALENNPDTKLVSMTHNETSTGVLNPLPEISKIVHDHGAILLADCITSAGGDEVRMDDWGIDIFVSGSQKCYGLPPGLAMITLSERAEEELRKTPRNQDFYTDLVTFADKITARNPPWTPAVSLFYGLQESLNVMLEEGMQKRIERHREMGRYYRQALVDLGLELFAEEGYRSNTVTTAVVPDSVEWRDFSSNMLDLGVMIAGGQADYKGKIFRFGHMNVVGPRELLMVMSTMEVALKRAGADIELGAGVRSIQQNMVV